VAASRNELDPDRRIIAMLAARGSHVAAAASPRDENRMI
jgi:hypothetical protein